MSTLPVNSFPPQFVLLQNWAVPGTTATLNLYTPPAGSPGPYVDANALYTVLAFTPYGSSDLTPQALVSCGAMMQGNGVTLVSREEALATITRASAAGTASAALVAALRSKLVGAGETA